MPFLIELAENVSFDDIERWNAPAGADVVFEIAPNASFQLLADGIALGMLRSLQKTANSISTLLRTRASATGATPQTRLLRSFFGLELIWISKIVSTTIDTALDIRGEIGAALLQELRESNGVFEHPGEFNLVTRNGRELPKAIRGQRVTIGARFPEVAVFKASVEPLLVALRKKTSPNYEAAGISESENVLLTWLFHCVENAFEHGATDPSNSGQIIRGFSGFSISRIWFDRARPLQSHQGLPRIAKNFFLQRQAENQLGSSGVGLCVTVADLGRGIQNTLRPVFPEKSDLEILQQSFIDGVTSKQHNTREKAGFGLGDMAAAARTLNGLVFVASGGLAAFHDFSEDQSKVPRSEQLRLHSYASFGKNEGTSISVLWPSNWQLDQQALPGF